MKTRLDYRTAWRDEISDYSAWIVRNDPAEATSWRLRLADDGSVEGALVEALAWRFLRDRVDSIEPFANRITAGRKPDFVCTTDGLEFSVDATCNPYEALSLDTGLRDEQEGFRSYTPHKWADGLAERSERKATQGESLPGPFVLLVGTLHLMGGALLYSRGHAPRTLPGYKEWQDHDYKTVCFQNNGGVNPGPFSDVPIHPGVSAKLLVGFGGHPLQYVGVLNQYASASLPVSAVRGVPFVKWRVWPPVGDAMFDWSVG